MLILEWLFISLVSISLLHWDKQEQMLNHISSKPQPLPSLAALACLLRINFSSLRSWTFHSRYFQLWKAAFDFSCSRTDDMESPVNNCSSTSKMFCNLAEQPIQYVVSLTRDSFDVVCDSKKNPVTSLKVNLVLKFVVTITLCPCGRLHDPLRKMLYLFIWSQFYVVFTK